MDPIKLRLILDRAVELADAKRENEIAQKAASRPGSLRGVGRETPIQCGRLYTDRTSSFFVRSVLITGESAPAKNLSLVHFTDEPAER